MFVYILHFARSTGISAVFFVVVVHVNIFKNGQEKSKLGFDANDFIVDQNNGFVKYLLGSTKTWEEVYQLIEAVTPRKLINFTCFKQQYNRKIVNTRKYSYSKCFLDLHFLFMSNDEDDNNKRQKFDEEVDYKKLYEDLLCSYRELEFKYKSLEETNVDLEEKLRSLEQSIFGKNKKIGGIKSALSRVNNLTLLFSLMMLVMPT